MAAPDVKEGTLVSPVMERLRMPSVICERMEVSLPRSKLASGRHVAGSAISLDAYQTTAPPMATRRGCGLSRDWGRRKANGSCRVVGGVLAIFDGKKSWSCVVSSRPSLTPAAGHARGPASAAPAPPPPRPPRARPPATTTGVPDPAAVRCRATRATATAAVANAPPTAAATAAPPPAESSSSCSSPGGAGGGGGSGGDGAGVLRARAVARPRPRDAVDGEGVAQADDEASAPPRGTHRCSSKGHASATGLRELQRAEAHRGPLGGAIMAHRRAAHVRVHCRRA